MSCFKLSTPVGRDNKTPPISLQVDGVNIDASSLLKIEFITKDLIISTEDHNSVIEVDEEFVTVKFGLVEELTRGSYSFKIVGYGVNTPNGIEFGSFNLQMTPKYHKYTTIEI